MAMGVACADDAPPEEESFRVAHAFRLPTAAQVSASRLSVTDAFEGLTFDDPVSMVQAGDRMFVAERGGRILSFDRAGAAAGTTVSLDLSDVTIAAKDSGLLALAPHPHWGDSDSDSRAHFYVFYAYIEAGPPEDPLNRTVHRTRLSRFTVDDAGVFDPASELVLIDQRDRHLYHQGGGMFFGPRDGFLYLSLGDEGARECFYGHCQRIDDALFGGVLRIDVDQRGGDVSHPIRSSPRDAVTAHYHIPSDNPFVDEPGVLEEFYAIGLRNPYRMTHDAVDDVTFIADVGESRREEIDVLAGGANYQWDVMEGDVMREMPHDPGLPRLGTWTDPFLSYPRSELRAVIGGHVYRGTAVPSLYGRYVHGGYRSGAIWAADYAIEDGEVVATGTEVVLETGFSEETGISSFAVDSERELYVLTLGQGSRVKRIVEAADPEGDVPRRLSDTGLFDDLTSLTPSAGLVEYRVNVPLWSDGARKRRFIAVPAGKPAIAKVDGPWDLPRGTVLVKHFELPVRDGDDSETLRLETRVLVVGDDGVHGATYKWRDDQSDATLLLEHQEESYMVETRDGELREHVHVYPSSQECTRCHAPEAGDALGVSTRQLNLELDEAPQLQMLEAAGVVDLSALAGVSDAALPRLQPLTDDGASLEARVRSYLDANCRFCHGDQQLDRVSWDARITTPLADAGIVNTPLATDDDGRTFIVKPGAPEASVMLERTATADPGRRMPPLATHRPDARFVALLEQWIETLP